MNKRLRAEGVVNYWDDRLACCGRLSKLIVVFTKITTIYRGQEEVGEGEVEIEYHKNQLTRDGSLQ